MSWLRRLLLLAGLVTGAWLLGGAGQAHADVRVEIDQLTIEVELPVADVEVLVETGLAPPPPEAPVPPEPDPRTDVPEPPREPPAVEAPVHVEVPAEPLPTPPPPVASDPMSPVSPQQPQSPPHSRAEQPVTGTLPQSGAGATASGTQMPMGTLPHAMWPPTTTTSLVSTERHDAPHTVRAEEPTFSPD
ncbi:hypothetical protein [Lentzea sp.]|uniref:hypothetical protein n=1 Tax=Lentzea sp. TaxID=56099 RepID=UPI002ED532BC